MRENGIYRADRQAEENRDRLRRCIGMLSDAYVVRVLSYLEGLNAGKEIERKKGESGDGIYRL